MPGGYAVGAGLLLLRLWLAAPALALPPVGSELPCIAQLRVGENADAGTCAKKCTANEAHGTVHCLPRYDSTRAFAREEGLATWSSIPSQLSRSSPLSGAPIDAKRMMGWPWCRAVVIGSAKCGTKEVQLWLGAHPKVRAKSTTHRLSMRYA